MKILLANPPCRIKLSSGYERYFVRAGSRWPFSTKKKREEKLEYVPFPFYLAYSAALLKKEGFEVHAYDGVALNVTEKFFLKKVKEINPDIVLFETSTPTISEDLKFAKEIKKQTSRVVICLAGPHVTTFPKKTLESCKEIDYVLLQEYELSFLDLCKILKEKQSPENIKGIAYRKDGPIQINKADLIDPLNQLPFPDRTIFPSNDKPDINVYWDGFCQYKPSVQMHASRGCPFRCNFCLWNQVMYQNGKYRMFPPKRIVDEMIDAQKKFGAKEIYFDDDTFTADKKQVLSICKEIKRRGLNIKWSVMGDAMISDKEMIDAMADAGCIGMKFGVESGNLKILKHIKKPVNFDKLRKVAKWCAARKIKTHATFTFGLSGESAQTMEETLDLAKSLDVDSVQFSITTPFPGTRYYDELREEGRLLAKNWKEYDGASSSIVKFEHLENKEVENFCATASGKWLRNKAVKPTWVLRQIFNLNRLRRGQGTKAIFSRVKRGFELASHK